ncbi:MAG: hypothetical protein IPO59_22110 [Betaproteobacteria bacterium]|nr:hypothetical protein [Betaproteobacteria bacterium]
MNLPVIDTLELSAIAFPANPYHRLVKGYKLLSDSRNDPVKDARLTLDLLVEEVDALFEMQRADPDWVSLLHFLLRDEAPLAAALEAVRNASAPSMASACSRRSAASTTSAAALAWHDCRDRRPGGVRAPVRACLCARLDPRVWRQLRAADLGPQRDP